MRTNYLLVSVSVLVLAFGIAVADPHARGGELVYGGGVSFALKAPTGWVLDAKSGRDQGMDAVYYAKGSSFGEARVIAYAHALPKHNQTIAQLIDQTVATMREHASQLVVDPTSAMTCGNNKSGRLLTVSHDPVGNAEALVFLDEADAVIVLGLIANDESHRTTAMPKLRELCSTYRFVGPVTH
ncbi:MAG TPA: hypothetical protein VFQ65_25620 [Kofleriaceae bacterium]|nr:hypothetical protein [Kofleriaceae bacterium]